MAGEMVEAKLDPESLRKIIAMAKEAPRIVKKRFTNASASLPNRQRKRLGSRY